MRGDVEDGTKDIHSSNNCRLQFHAQYVCLTDNEYEALANSDSIWERKSCRKPELPDLNSKTLWTLYISIFSKQAYAKAKSWCTIISKTAVDLPTWCILCFCSNDNRET